MTSIQPSRVELEGIVDSRLNELIGCQRFRDLEGAVAMFADDAIVFGSAASEQAVGLANIREFFRQRFSLPVTYGWTWEKLLVQGSADTISFVAPGEYQLRSDDGGEEVGYYRITGVLRLLDGEWKFALWTGAQPVADDKPFAST
jgi:ketosteroid isomerase-like protein